MAINKRTYPNDYFAWYNDDSRLAILTQDTTNDSNQRTTEKYDTFQGTGDLSETITGVTRSGANATYTTSKTHSFAVGDRVSISGTTNFNDEHLTNNTITLVGSTTFSMTLKAETASAESGLSATATSLFINDGIRITYHAKYESVSAITDNLQTGAGVDSGLHPAIVCFVKARLYEDQGDMERAMYFRKMYEKSVMQYPSRKSGVRTLAVPHM